MEPVTPLSPAPAQGRPRDARLDAAVLDAFRVLLEEVGYPRISVEQVARHAGVGKPAIYRRWHSKAAIAVDCLAATVVLDTAPDTGSLRGDVLAAWELMRQTWEQPRAGQNVAGLLVDLQDDEQALALFRERVQGPRTASLDRMIDRAVARGELRTPDDARWALGALEGVLVQWDLFAGGRAFPADYADFVVRAVLAELERGQA